jgi:hypothetical protein
MIAEKQKLRDIFVHQIWNSDLALRGSELCNAHQPQLA